MYIVVTLTELEKYRNKITNEYLFNAVYSDLVELDFLYGKKRDLGSNKGGFDIIIEDNDNIKEEMIRLGIYDIYYNLENQKKFAGEKLIFGSPDNQDKAIVRYTIYKYHGFVVCMYLSFKKYKEFYGAFTYDGLQLNAYY